MYENKIEKREFSKKTIHLDEKKKKKIMIDYKQFVIMQPVWCIKNN